MLSKTMTDVKIFNEQLIHPFLTRTKCMLFGGVNLKFDSPSSLSLH